MTCRDQPRRAIVMPSVLPCHSHANQRLKSSNSSAASPHDAPVTTMYDIAALRRPARALGRLNRLAALEPSEPAPARRAQAANVMHDLEREQPPAQRSATESN